MSTLQQKRRILFIPSTIKGNGTGHMRRCVKLAEELIRLGAEAAVLAEREGLSRAECYSFEDVSGFLSRGRQKKPRILSEAVPTDWDLCVFDYRKTPLSGLERFSGQTVCAAIDEGGTEREYFDYIIDTLPNLEKTLPNIMSTGFLQLPERDIKKTDSRIFDLSSIKVLISFGGEDELDLTGKMLAAIDDIGIFRPDQITVVRGPCFSSATLPDDVNVLESPENLGELLKNYDLLFTMFGLTCFEALYSFVPVILFNPADYHRNLSIRAGIPEIGVRIPDVAKMEEYLYDPERLWRSVKNYSSVEKLSLASHLLTVSGGDRNGCRGCGSSTGKVIYRTTEKSFMKCSVCGMVNQFYYGSSKMEYGTDYFFDDYQKQYGRTYLEDFRKIKSHGELRCREIKKKKKNGKLLDIGCGYGPFLEAASESGFIPLGIEISADAAEYVNSQLGIKAINLPFEKISPEAPEFSGLEIITMWYVIEHLTFLPDVLTQVNLLLPKGGVFAFSTPNYNGISRRVSAMSFFDSNPLDHYTIWSPASARRLLKKYGFRIVNIKCPNLHPERYFKKPGNYEKMNIIFRKIFNIIAGFINRCFLTGDTFEVYAVKKNDLKAAAGE